MKRTHPRQLAICGAVMTLTVALLIGARVNDRVSADSQTQARIITPFDTGWRFLKADAAGAEKPDFADAAWRALNVPHDWSIEGPFDEKNSTGGAGAFVFAGVGWYRKHFTVPADFARRRVFVEFDGVMANSDAWINGFHLGNRPNGYVSFRYEMTGHLNFGGTDNVLAVRADSSRQPASRWGAGAGIYRHVRLVVTAPVHIEHWGTFITTSQVGNDRATVHVHSTVANQSDAPREVVLQITVLGPDGGSISTAATKPQTIPAGTSVNYHQDILVKDPQRWDLGYPVLYRALTKVTVGKTIIDDDLTPFGIREFHFDAATGFWLNGRNFKLKRVCLHHDASAFGAAVPLRAWERRLESLKQIGVNAIRTAHNPPAPEFLDLCDRMGVLVMDEMFDCWLSPRTLTTIISTSTSGRLSIRATPSTATAIIRASCSTARAMRFATLRRKISQSESSRAWLKSFTRTTRRVR